jgi:hypothetical protein
MSFLQNGLLGVFAVGEFGFSSRNIPIQFVVEAIHRRDKRKRNVKLVNNFILQNLSLCGIYRSVSTVT